MDQTAQVVIVGAGPAGSATAIALAARGVDVLLLDKATFPREKTCGDGLTPRALAVLQEMELLPKLEAAGALRVQGVRIYAPDGGMMEANFDELPGDFPLFGLTIPRRTLDAVLLDYAQASGARFASQFRVTELMYNDGALTGVRGTWNGEPAVVRAPLICLATGAAMPLVKKAGLLPAVPPVMRAARTYFDGTKLEPVFQLHFDRNLLPGYGWIFPLSGGRANVGAGYFPSGKFRHRSFPPRRLYDIFVGQNPAAQSQLAGATPAGPVKSYPLRTDFLTMQTYNDGLLLVGEAAGLVNPINGEGVDYALESGLLAAKVIADALADGDLSAGRLALYGQRLHERYLTLFRYLIKMRDWYIRERVLNLIVSKAQRRPQLRFLFVNAALGLIDPKEGVSLRSLRDIIF